MFACKAILAKIEHIFFEFKEIGSRRSMNFPEAPETTVIGSEWGMSKGRKQSDASLKKRFSCDSCVAEKGSVFSFEVNLG